MKNTSRIWKIALVLCLLAAAFCIVCAHAEAYPESKHPYDENSYETWSYTYPETASYLKITFSDDSALEMGYDTLTITSEDGTSQRLTGSLKGREVFTKGRSFTLCLESDESYQDYGFKITSVQKATQAEYEQLRFQIQGGVLTGFTGHADEIVVPSVIDGQTVTDIGYCAFQGADFKSISLPSTVSFIGYYAFMDCSHLTDITIPSGVTGIGDWAFCNCSALTGITIPNSVTDIGYGIFMGCTKLESITVPNSVTIIGDCAFQDCTSLTDITIPNKVTNITYSTFRGCTSLKNITIPSSVTSIGDCAFENCSALTGITIPGSVTSIGSSTFANCGSLTDITIPNSVTSIGSSAFYNCGGLETVIFKCAEFELGPSVFYACTALKEVHIAESMSEFPENWPDLGAAIIVLSQNCPLLTEVRERCIWYRVIETGETNVVSSSATTVKEKVADIVATVIQPGMSDYQKALVLHNWLIFNANYDYTYSNYYADGVLLKGTGVCQSYAFAYRELLNAVGIQNDFEYGFDHVWNMVLLDGEWYHVDCTWDDPNEGGWERWDFFGVTNEALTAVDNHECFNKPHIATAYRCNYNYRNGLIDSYIEDISKNVLSHVSDGEAAFNMDISSWTDVIGMRYYTALAAVRDRQLYYESKPFPAQFSVGSDHSALNVRVGVERDADFVLPKALKEIGEEAFENTDAAVVEIPDGVTSIGSEAFAYSADLRQITIPESVDSIAGNAFRGVSGLRIVGDRGSCAEDFARDAGILFVADD